MNWPCVRPKRPAGSLAEFSERVVVVMPLRAKNELRRIARENNLGQGELAWVLLRVALADAAHLATVLGLERQRRAGGRG